ncbi:DUF4124 domain-containing protein [Niveibacterium sp. SC-1]|uniref:DUF4124 domain-containing protein n=1 Tax=Niveibacterium sp. SC-1 TaxID=3135646 RepID=UPI00311DACC3
MLRIALTIALAALPLAAQAQDIHKCVANGAVSYSDAPCPAAAQASTVAPPHPVSDENYWSAMTNGYVAQQRINDLHADEMGRVAARDAREAAAREATARRAEQLAAEERRRADMIAFADRLRGDWVAQPYRASHRRWQRAR